MQLSATVKNITANPQYFDTPHGRLNKTAGNRLLHKVIIQRIPADSHRINLLIKKNKEI